MTFWNGFGKGTRYKEETMTKVATINVPQYVVETTPSDVFFAWEALDSLTRAQAFKEILKVSTLNSTIRLSCASEDDAADLADLICDNGPEWNVPVRSDNYDHNGVEYTVHGRGLKATRCTCDDFYYHGAQKKRCKHMVRVESFPSSYGVPL